MPKQGTMHTVVLISANTEWRVVRSHYPEPELHPSPFGDWFIVTLAVGEQAEPVIFFHGGWGKIAAAASTQYVIDRRSPALLVNLGTCGGFEGEIAKGTILLVERTMVYDIMEMMSDAEAAIASYTTALDLTWLGESYPTKCSVLCSSLLTAMCRSGRFLTSRPATQPSPLIGNRVRLPTSRPATGCTASFCGV